MVSRVFYEASRDLDSQPPLRTDHVEACRPQELCTSSILSAHGPRSRIRALHPLDDVRAALEWAVATPAALGAARTGAVGDHAFLAWGTFARRAAQAIAELGGAVRVTLAAA